MKVLLDTCVWGSALQAVAEAGHDVVWSGDWQPDPGDDETLRRAAIEGRVMVTLDKDFGDLIFLRGQDHCGLIRLVGFRATEQGPVCV